MSRTITDVLILIECASCGSGEYFETDSLPGGAEHCPYCATCGEMLPRPDWRESLMEVAP